jgi:hypothetical protein
LSTTEGFFGLGLQFVCCNHEYAIRILVRNVEDLQEAAGQGLTDLSARVSGRPQVFATSPQDLFDFRLRNAVPIKVGLASVWVEVVPNFQRQASRKVRSIYNLRYYNKHRTLDLLVANRLLSTLDDVPKRAQLDAQGPQETPDSWM